jgi:cob(I)alamin adenosyltransferase
LGAQFANDEDNPAYQLPDVVEEDILFLEKAIDIYTDQLPELKSFILPGGHILVAQTHIARTICRRAERLAVELSEKYEINPIHIKYLNRLSDFLFVLARKLAFDLNVEELIWTKNIIYPEIRQ